MDVACFAALRQKHATGARRETFFEIPCQQRIGFALIECGVARPPFSAPKNVIQTDLRF
jgi:hypothetical protein